MNRSVKIAREPTHPGFLLRDVVIPETGLSKSQVAEVLDVSRNYLYRLMNGEVAMSLEMCMKVGKFAGNGAELWLNMQKTHDLWRAEHDPKVMRAVRKVPAFKDMAHA